MVRWKSEFDSLWNLFVYAEVSTWGCFVITRVHNYRKGGVYDVRCKNLDKEKLVKIHGPLVHRLEREAFNLRVAGSTPAWLSYDNIVY